MASTNTLVNNVCYPSISAAADAFFSAHPVTFFINATDTYRLLFYKSGSSWGSIKEKWDSVGSKTTIYNIGVSAPSFPACDATQPYFDGMQIGWGIVAAMIAVYGVILIRKAFFQ